MKMNPVVHFGMPAEDGKRVSEFYTKVFGWKMKQYGPDFGNYILVHTAETDENGMIKRSGAINGGFFTKTKDASIPMLTIAVDDIKESMKMVESAGGKIIGKIEDMKGIGMFVNIIDSEGNKMSMMQPAPRQ